MLTRTEQNIAQDNENEHTTENFLCILAYLELLRDLLDYFLALLFFLLQSLLFCLEKFLIPAFGVLQTFRCVYRM